MRNIEMMGHNDLAYSATVDPSRPTVADNPRRAHGSIDALELSARSTVLPRLVRAGEQIEPSAAGPRFVPMRLLGRGGMGEVTLVQDKDIDRQVALKRLRSDAATDDMLYRFAEEVRTVGQLEHPNIAPVHDVGVDDRGHHYFVMRYVEGETLEAIIARLADGDPDYHERFTFAHRVQLFFGVLHAIAYAHSKGIIHRDIKPSNIIVGPYGEVVVMDWGVAKRRDDQPTTDDAAPAAPNRTAHGSLVGTPAYMSPEQAIGANDRIDERSDIYSLAVVLYELLTLQHYMSGRTTVPELLAAIVDEPHEVAARLTNPSPHQEPVPAELSWFIEKGLAKDPAARFQSVAEMGEHLERVMAGAFPVQCPVTFLKKAGGNTVRAVDRHPVLMMAAAGVVLALVGFAVVDLIARLVL